MSVMTAVAAKVTKAMMKEKAIAGIEVPHMLYDQLLWHKKLPPAHPTLNLEVSVSTSGYEHFGAPTPPATRRRTTTLKTLADTGCQACCMGPAQLHSLGLNSSHLLIPELNLRAANATGYQYSILRRKPPPRPWLTRVARRAAWARHSCTHWG